MVKKAVNILMIIINLIIKMKNQKKKYRIIPKIKRASLNIVKKMKIQKNMNITKMKMMILNY